MEDDGKPFTSIVLSPLIISHCLLSGLQSFASLDKINKTEEIIEEKMADQSRNGTKTKFNRG